MINMICECARIEQEFSYGCGYHRTSAEDWLSIDARHQDGSERARTHADSGEQTCCTSDKREVAGFEFELADVLTAMGMPGAFIGADFSGMTGNRDLFISEVVHKAYVDVNEEGTEAAAATGVVMKRGGAVFRVDRPFIFLIRENRTGSVLFIGRITDPTA